MVRWRDMALGLLCYPLMVLGAPGGETVAPRIVGGSQTLAPGWMVAFGVSDSNALMTTWQQQCGGVLIDPQWVLTAAHCVDTVSLDGLEVAIGVADLRQPHTRIAVSQVIMHDGYLAQFLDPTVTTRQTLNDDLALLRLATSSTETPIVLGGEQDVQPDMWLTGWGYGATQPDKQGYSPALKRVELQFAGLSNRWYHTDSRTHLFAGGIKGQDTCRGDSGGPLTDAGGRLLGITSYGPEVCGKGVPAAYSYVSRSDMADWVQAQQRTLSITSRQMVEMAPGEQRWLGVTLLNATDAAVTLADMRSDTPAPPQSACPPSLAPGQSCQVRVRVDNPQSPDGKPNTYSLDVTAILANGASQRLRASLVGAIKKDTPALVPTTLPSPDSRSGGGGGGSGGIVSLGLLALLALKRR